MITLAGNGVQGFLDGYSSYSYFNNPTDVCADFNGSVYVADSQNHRIRKVNTTGYVSTFAGNGDVGYMDGNSTEAMFNLPMGIAIDTNGTLYVADSGSSTIRMISKDGTVTTLAGKNGTAGYLDGPTSIATFTSPRGIAVGQNGDVFVSDNAEHRIRKISGGMVTTIAGNGTRGYFDGLGTSSMFDSPAGLDVDSSGSIYVADVENNRIRRISAAGQVTTFAGGLEASLVSGTNDVARFNGPTGLVLDKNGNLIVADSKNNVIRNLTSAGVYVAAGNSNASYANGFGPNARFRVPSGVASSKTGGQIYIADSGNHRIRQISIILEE